jgi:hypothetical protein
MRFSGLLTIMGLFTCFGKHGEEAAKPMPGRRRLFGGAKANQLGHLGRRLWPLVGTGFVLVALIPATSATATAKPPAGDAKVISDWNQIATSTMVGDTTKAGHPQVILYMGLVQAAVYDAVVGIDRRYQPYSFQDRAPHPSSGPAAVVAAAHKVLVTYFPYAQATLDAAYANSLAQIPDGKAKTNGIAYGIRAADNLITLRAHDGRDASFFFTQPPAPGVWRPTPPPFLSMFDPWLGFVTPLLVHSPLQFAPPPPPVLTSDRYTRDFNEVKAYGSATAAARTPEQTTTAQFFSGNAFVQFNAALRDQAAVRNLDIVQSARMFAAITMSAADAIITVWHAKYVYGLWRPITAINMADTDGNPATTADATWVPLIPTPAYPEYPSGYNAYNASVIGGLEELFHTRQLNLTLISTAVPGMTRHYDSGTAERADVVNARVWLGIHFRTADVASRNLGLQLSDWTIDHYFQPVDQD